MPPHRGPSPLLSALLSHVESLGGTANPSWVDGSELVRLDVASATADRGQDVAAPNAWVASWRPHALPAPESPARQTDDGPLALLHRMSSTVAATDAWIARMTCRVAVACCPLTNQATTLWFPHDGGSRITAEIVGLGIARRFAPREHRLTASTAARDALRGVDPRLHVEAVGFSAEGELVEVWVAGRVRHLRALLHTARHDHWLRARRLLRRLDDHAAVARVRLDGLTRVAGFRFEMGRLRAPQRHLLVDQAHEEGLVTRPEGCCIPPRRVAVADASAPLSFVTTHPACLLVDLHERGLEVALEWRAEQHVHPAARLLGGSWTPTEVVIVDEGAGHSGTYLAEHGPGAPPQALETVPGTTARARK